MSDEDDKVIPFPTTGTHEPVSKPDWLDLQILEDARDRPEHDPLFGELHIYAAILLREDEKPAIVHFLPEYGDDDGFHTIREYIRTIRSDPSALKPGEELRFQLFIFNFHDKTTEIFDVWDDGRRARYEPTNS